MAIMSSGPRYGGQMTECGMPGAVEGGVWSVAGENRITGEFQILSAQLGPRQT